MLTRESYTSGEMGKGMMVYGGMGEDDREAGREHSIVMMVLRLLYCCCGTKKKKKKKKRKRRGGKKSIRIGVVEKKSIGSYSNEINDDVKVEKINKAVK